MDKTELVIEIIEKVHDNVQRVEAKLDAMAEEQTRQNVVVERHEQRSTTAEKRMELFELEVSSRLSQLEKDSQFARNAVVIISALGGLTLFVMQIIPFFVH
jgi:3-deoxy-D-manno-octulosonic-acid transferase